MKFNKYFARITTKCHYIVFCEVVFKVFRKTLF